MKNKYTDDRFYEIYKQGGAMGSHWLVLKIYN